MKFVIIASNSEYLFKFRSELLEDISEKGYEIHIIAPDLDLYDSIHRNFYNLEYVLHSVPLNRTGLNPIEDIDTLKALYFKLKKIKPNILLTYTIKPVIYGSIAAWLAGVPNCYSLITGLGYAFQKAEKQSKRNIIQLTMQSMYRVALSKVDKVIFQNIDDLNLFKEMNIIPLDKPTKVVNGSGINVYKYPITPLPQTKSLAKPSFLLIARLLVDKGIREYIEAARIVKKRYPNTEFNLVGWIDTNPHAISESELQQWVDEGLITYWGKLNNVKPAISSSSIYVLPSYREGTPRTVLEAMSMGRPIITTDAPGCRETVIDNYNGFLVPVKSVDKLVEAMEKFIINPGLIVEMGSASRALAEQKFNVISVNKVMLEAMNI